MAKTHEIMKIGEASSRSGVTTSTLRFYETRGLIHSQRGSGNHRIYNRSVLRRIAIVKFAQTLGLSLSDIGEALKLLPDNRVPNKKDWEGLSKNWRNKLDQRIGDLQKMRDQLTSCIGCGCLSLKRCSIYNAGDRVAKLGAGPRYLLGDMPKNDSDST